MKSTTGYKNRIINKLLILIITIILFTNIINIKEVEASEENLEWSVTLNFNEPDGSNNNLFFGESSDASDVQDSYDVPIPPPGIPPYIRPWFDSGLNEPYNSLFYDIKKYPDDSKIWDLFVQWVPSDYTSSKDITISWDITEIISSEYESVVLFDYKNEIIVCDMLIDNFFTYESSAMEQSHFQIICNSTATPNNPPFEPSNPSPGNGATDVNVDKILTWSGGDPDLEDVVKYDVYFGNNLVPPIVSNNQSSLSYNPGLLNYNKNYYWKIISWDSQGEKTQGPLWHFTTGSQTPPPQNNPPIANIKSPKQGYINQTITLDASNSYDSDGFIKYYRWDFTNDGKWDTDWIEEPFIKYIYFISGNYTIKLQIKDNEGAIDTETKSISILFLEEDNFFPIADPDGPYYGKINQNITFDASNSYDPDGIILNYSWDFGDGHKSFSKKTNHSFTIKGTYFVTLFVIDNDGLVGEESTIAYIFDNDSDNDGWGDDEETEYGTDPNNSEDFPLDTDNDRIPDSIDDNDDNDGLSDKLEIRLGSDPKNKSDVVSININGAIHFLIDIDLDGKSDLFYNSRSGNITYIEIKSKNKYLLDEDGDGKWDYIYDYMLGTIEPYKYENASAFPFLQSILILLFIIVLLIVVGIFYKKILK